MVVHGVLQSAMDESETKAALLSGDDGEDEVLSPFENQVKHETSHTPKEDVAIIKASPTLDKITDDIELEFNDMLEQHVGEFGRHQIVSTIIKCVETMVSGFYALGPVFMAATPDHGCDITDQIPVGFGNCTPKQMHQLFIPKEVRHDQVLPSECEYYRIDGNIYNTHLGNDTELCSFDSLDNLDTSINLKVSKANCDKWIYDKSFYTSSVVSEWDLVCSKASLVSNANGAYWLGMMASLLIAGHLADRFGRRPIGIIGYVMTLMTGFLTAFSPTYTVFLVARFLTSFFFTMRSVGIGIIALELTGDSWRLFYMSVGHLAWVMAYPVMSAIAYYERRWRYLQVIITLPIILEFLFFVFYLTESPRWLLTRNKKKESMKLLNIIAKRNNRFIPPNINASVKQETHSANALQLIRFPSLRIVTLVLFIVWFGNGFVYYGISMNTSNLGGNPFITFLISGAVELPGALCLPWIFRWFGRVKPFIICFVVAGAGLLCAMPVPQDNALVLISLAMMGKLFISVSFVGAWIYSMEVYPTSVRSIGVHTCSFVARIGAFLASYIGILSNMNRALPLLVFGAVSMTTGLLAFILPDTLGAPITETIQEGELFMKENMCKTCCCRSKSRSYNLTLKHHEFDSEQEEKLIASDLDEDSDGL